MPSCPTCPPYFGEGDFFVKHVTSLSAYTRYTEQQAECVDCMSAPASPTGAGVRGFTADVNNDGFPDLIVGKGKNSSSFRLLLNDGKSSFLDSGLNNFPQVDDIISVLVADFRSDQSFRKAFMRHLVVYKLRMLLLGYLICWTLWFVTYLQWFLYFIKSVMEVQQHRSL